MMENLQSPNPQLIIDGKAVKPAPPKMRVWREFVAFEEKDTSGLTMTEILDEHYRLIAVAFGKPEITKEAVEDALELADVIPYVMELRQWLRFQVTSKLNKLPNGEAGTD